MNGRPNHTWFYCILLLVAATPAWAQGVTQSTVSPPAVVSVFSTLLCERNDQFCAILPDWMPLSIKSLPYIS